MRKVTLPNSRPEFRADSTLTSNHVSILFETNCQDTLYKITPGTTPTNAKIMASFAIKRVPKRPFRQRILITTTKIMMVSKSKMPTTILAAYNHIKYWSKKSVLDVAVDKRSSKIRAISPLNNVTKGKALRLIKSLLFTPNTELIICVPSQ